MSLLQTLLRPDHDEHPERAEAARAATLLQIGEFQLIQLAYFGWFGADMPEAEGHRLFHVYMMHSQIPHWVRHYARNILALDEAGTLDGDDPRYHRYDPDHGLYPPHAMGKLILACLLVVVVLGGGFIVGHFAVGTGGSILPPYFTAEELKGS